jgi:hypothetical protein
MKSEIRGNKNMGMQPAALSGILFFPFFGEIGVKVLHHG